MNHTTIHTYRFLHFGLFAILLAAGATAMAQQEKEGQQHRIVLIKELIRDMSDAVWTNQDGTILAVDNHDERFGRVSHGVLHGVLRHSMLSPDYSLTQPLRIFNHHEPIHYKSIAVELVPTYGNECAMIRGAYPLTLPDLKRIQLELNYDRILDESDRNNAMQFSVSIQERDQKGDWQQSAQLQASENKMRRETNRIIELSPEEGGDLELFTSHAFTANLSPWAGKEIQLVLQAENQNLKKPQCRGRWLQAKLVGSTFDFRIIVNK